MPRGCQTIFTRSDAFSVCYDDFLPETKKISKYLRLKIVLSFVKLTVIHMQKFEYLHSGLDTFKEKKKKSI